MSKPFIYAILVALLLAGGVWWGIKEKNNNAAPQVNLNSNSLNTNQVANSNVAVNQNTNSGVPEGWAVFSKVGYAMNYPQDWALVNISDSMTGLRPKNINPADKLWAVINIIDRDNPKALDLKSFYTQADDFENIFEVNPSPEGKKLGLNDTLYFEVIPGAVADSVYVFRLRDMVIEVRMHRDQIGKITGLEEIFSEVVASIK